MRKLLNNLFVLFFFGAIFSCAPNYLSKFNEIKKDDYLYLVNEKIRISIHYFADYEFYRSNIKSEEFHYFRKIISGYLLKKPIRFKSTVYTNKTIIAPYFYSGLFTGRKENLNLDKIKVDFTYDSTGSPIGPFYEKIEFTQKINTSSAIRLYTMKNHYFVLILFLKPDFLNNTDTQNSLNILKSECKDIFNSIEIGK